MADSPDTDGAQPFDSATPAPADNTRGPELLALIACIQRDVALYGLVRQDLFPDAPLAAAVSTVFGLRAPAGVASRRGRQRS